MQSFGDRVRTLRDKQGWTQEKLSEECNVTAKYISDIETGKRPPAQLTVRTVERLASALHIHPRDLLYPESTRDVPDL